VEGVDGVGNQDLRVHVKWTLLGSGFFFKKNLAFFWGEGRSRGGALRPTEKGISV